MNRKEFFKVSAAASLASLLSPLSAYAEKFESEGKKPHRWAITFTRR